MPRLPKDTDLHFPHEFVITASAGSGKTYTLSRRYAQFLLSDAVPGNSLKSILAITFTNLAAKEMKERILTLLKEAALGNNELLEELSALIGLSKEQISLRASTHVDEILRNFSDFNVRTIDSFMSTVFKASSLEFGYQPDVDITLDPDELIGQTFESFSRELQEGSAQAKFIDRVISLIEENERGMSSFLWNPFSKIIREVRNLHDQLGKYAGEPHTIDADKKKHALADKIKKLAFRAREKFVQSELPLNPYFAKDLERIIDGDVLNVASKKEWSGYISQSKLNKEAKGKYESIKKGLFTPVNALNKSLNEYALVYAQSYYQPFIQAVQLIDEKFKEIKRLQGTVILDDVNRTLAHYLIDADIPQVYIKLGETINHFMLDEFQDTNPIQWYNLHPLIENALSTRGSLFVVGDTKQSIYGFRGADWRIMKELEENPHYFPSAQHQVIHLDTNYRSSEAIVTFVKEVFETKTKEIGFDSFAKESGLRDAGQKVPKEQKGNGYVEVKFIKQQEDDEIALDEQRQYVIGTIQECIRRGYTYKDFALLTPANADVVQVSSWLNEESIPFISHSTLDIRRRKIIGEILAFLRFLDSPIDDRSFATCVLGDIFAPLFRKEGIRPSDIHELFSSPDSTYVYQRFRKSHRAVWDHYFDSLFSRVGYLPLYDLVSETLKTLSVVESFPGEESAVVKFLECVKNFENTGNNSIKDFLTFSSEESDDTEWSIDIPGNVQAVRVMTVHKAKGLGFPVVIALFKDKKRRNTGPIVEESGETVSVWKITEGLAARNKLLAEKLEKKIREETIDDLNKLYVALTRAEREMYILSIEAKDKKSKKTGEPDIKVPSMLFPSKPFGKKYTVIVHDQLEEDQAVSSEYRPFPATLPVTQYEKIGLAETMRGDFVHTVLSKIEFLSSDPHEQLLEAIREVNNGIAEKYDAEKMSEVLGAFLSFPDVAPYFQKTESLYTDVLREQDFVTAAGQLFRMDRVVIGRDTASVVDFKTGSDEMNEKYQDQVRNYIAILKEIYPKKKITGALLYVDMRKVVPVL